MNTTHTRVGGQWVPDEEEEFGLGHLIPQYFNLCQRDLVNLRTALEEKAFDRVRILGHNLKGSGGAYGFPELSEIGAELESAGKSFDSGKAKRGVARLAEFLNAPPPRGSGL